MKKGKFLAVAALISCCTVLAACNEISSSGETSSTTTSEPDSSEDSSSGYSSSSEDSSSEDSSSYESSSEDSSSSSDSSSEDSSSSSSEDSSSEEPDPDSSSSEEPDPGSSSSEEPDPDSSSSEEPEPEPAKYKITSITNYNSTYIPGISLNEGDEYEAGSTVNYSLSVSYSGNTITLSNFYIGVNGSVTNPTSYEAGSEEHTYTFYGSFVMPEEDIDITLAYQTNTAWDESVTSYTPYTVHVENDDYITWLAYADNTQYYNYTYATFARKPGAKLVSLEYKTSEDGEWAELSSSFSNYNNNLNAYYTYVNSSYLGDGSDIWLKVNYEVVAIHSLNLVNSDLIDISSNSYYDTTVTTGDTIYISYTGADGHYVSAAADIVDADGNDVSTTSNSYSSSYSSTLRFTMPDSDVTVTFHVGTAATLTADDNNEALSTQVYYATSYTSTSHITSAAPGTSIYVCASAADNYIIDSFTVNDVDYDATHYTSSYSNIDIYYTRYTIPEDAETVYAKANVSLAYTASTDISSTYASVRFGNSSTSATYTAGSSVSFTITPTAYYSVTEGSVALTDGTGTNVAISDLSTNSNGIVTGSFTMPESNVTLSASFTEKETKTLTLSVDENISSIISGATVQGSTSGASLSYGSDSVASFIVGESLTIRVTYSNSANYDFSIYAVDSSSNQTLLSSNASTSYTSATCTLTSDLAGFYITGSEKQILNVTYDIEDALTVNYAYSTTSTYYTSGITTVDSLDNLLYSGYYVYFQVSGLAAGYSANISVTDANNNNITVTNKYLYDESYSPVAWYCFTAPSTNFTISIHSQAMLLLNVEVEDGISSDNYQITNDTTGDYLSTGANYADAGDSVRIQYYNTEPVLYYYVDYEEADDVSGSLPAESGARYVSFTLAADATLHLTLEEYTPAEEEETPAVQSTTINYDSTFNSGYTYFTNDGWEKKVAVGDDYITFALDDNGVNSLSTKTDSDGNTIYSTSSYLKLVTGQILSITLPSNWKFNHITFGTQSMYSFGAGNSTTTTTGATMGDNEATFDSATATNEFSFSMTSAFCRITSFTIDYIVEESDTKSESEESGESESTEPSGESTITCDDSGSGMIYYNVYSTTDATAQNAETDTRILTKNETSVTEATVATGSYIYLENTGAAIDYTITFDGGTTYTGSLEAWNAYTTDNLLVTGNCTIVLTLQA